MYESFLATLLFWSAFGFSVGPFWLAIMEEARHSTFTRIYKNYLLYLCVGWLPVIATIGIAVSIVGGISEHIINALYFIGFAVICFFAWKVLQTKDSTKQKFVFTWQKMVLLSWTNPKVWLTVPGGFLAANYSQSVVVNILLFYVISLPIFLLNVYIWGWIGRQGAKITAGRINYLNAALLLAFALYLLYQGISVYTH